MIARRPQIGSPLLATWIALVALLPACSPPPSTAREAVSPRVVARIDGEPITSHDFSRYLRQLDRESGASSATLTNEQRDLYRKRALDRLIDQQILLREAALKAIGVSDKMVDLALAWIKADYKPDAFKEMLLDRNTTEAFLRAEVRQRLIIERLIEQAVTARIDTSDKEVEAFFEKHRDMFKRPEQARVSQIVVKTEEQATELRRLVRRGASSFAEHARKYSLSPDGEKGGDLGWISRGSMPEVFDRGCFDLPIGRTSQVITSDYGYHLCRVTDRRPKRKLRLDEVREQIRTRLRQEKATAAEKRWMADLRASVRIERFPESAEVTP